MVLPTLRVLVQLVVGSPFTLASGTDLAARRYYCSDCDYATSCQQKLNKHIKTEKHLEKVAEPN